MFPARVLLIAPYEGLKEQALKLAEGRADIRVDAMVGNLDDGARIAAHLSLSEYDAVISRGGTAELIDRQTRIPLIRIRLSEYDMLRTLLIAKSFSSRFAVVGFPDITECVDLVSELAELSLETKTLHPGDDVKDVLQALKREGIALVVGDTVTVETARELGMNTMLITSGSESISAAFDAAVQIRLAKEAAMGQSALLEAVLENCPFDFVVYDARHQVVSLRRQSLESRALTDMTSPYIDQLLKKGCIELSEEGEEGPVKMRGKAIFADSESYAMFFCSISTGVFSLNSSGVSEPKNRDLSLFKQFYLGCPGMDRLTGYAKALSRASEPILVRGERGTLRACAAQYMYQCGHLQDMPYYEIDCGVVGGRQLSFLLTNLSSPLYNINSAILLANVDALEEEGQRQLYAFIRESSLNKRNMVTYSFRPEGQGCFLVERLLSDLGRARLLSLPPLRERREELRGLSSICLSDLNIRLGQQLCGFEPQAAQLLEEYDWPLNIPQFIRVLSELAAEAEGKYITGQSVQSLLNQEEVRSLLNAPDAVFPQGTLEEITRYVVERVLREENMNQTRAAGRLGVSRSTLWRMLKY